MRNICFEGYVFSLFAHMFHVKIVYNPQVINDKDRGLYSIGTQQGTTLLGFRATC